jgi:hypothetical protein
MKTRGLGALVVGLALGLSTVAVAGPFSGPVTGDSYNSNKNGVPTPNMTNITNSNGGPYDLFNAVNYLYGSNTYESNSALDPLYYANDSTWVMNSGHAAVRQIGGTAKNSNKFGFFYYDANVQLKKSPALVNTGEIFQWAGAGTITNPFPGNDFSMTKGTTIGWYIESTDWKTGTVTTFYSDPQLNPDGYDHMVTYSLSGLAGNNDWIQLPYVLTEIPFSTTTYLIGFEDRLFGDYGGQFNGTLGDDDYNDLLILIDSSGITPSPHSIASAALSSVAPAAVPEPATITLMFSGLAGLFLYGRRMRRQ